MPRYYPNHLFSDCWSSVGNVTFYHKDGKCYWRSRSRVRFSGTESQMECLDVHRRALAAWREISEDERMMWNEYALGVPSHRPPYTRDHSITGHNLFVSAYHGFAVLGQEHTPEPQRFRKFPAFAMEFEGAELLDDPTNGIRLTFRLYSGNGFSDEDYAVLGRLQLTEPGRGCHPGMMRNILADEIVSVSPGVWQVTFTIDDASRFGICEMNTFGCHLRYRLIDRKTGYRSQQQRLKADVCTASKVE